MTSPGEFDLLASFGPLLDPWERRRWQQLSETKRGLRDARQAFPRFDQRFCVPVPTSDASPSNVLGTLRERGARNDCFVVPFCWGADEEPQVAPLKDTLEMILMQTPEDVVLVCIPGKLAFRQDDQAYREIIHRT